MANKKILSLIYSIGGMTAAVFTAPLDVLKTRLQSDFYQAQLRAAREAATATAGGGHVRMTALRSMRYHLAETFQILRDVYRLEGWRALFKGLGPNLVGVIPARSINFYVYGTGKRAYSTWTGTDATNPWVHLAAAATAGIATSTATNPIWLVKTRLQLDKNDAARKGDVSRRAYRNSWDCIRQVLRNEGPTGFFKGMSASYLGVTESTLHWVLYENFKERLRHREARLVRSGRERTWWDNTVSWTGNFFSAGASKAVAAILAYPHEVSLSIRSFSEFETSEVSVHWLNDISIGCEDTPSTSPYGRREAQVHRPSPLLQACLEGRGFPGSVRRPDPSPYANHPLRCRHVWHVRSHSEVFRIQELVGMHHIYPYTPATVMT